MFANAHDDGRPSRPTASPGRGKQAGDARSLSHEKGHGETPTKSIEASAPDREGHGPDSLVVLLLRWQPRVACSEQHIFFVALRQCCAERWHHIFCACGLDSRRNCVGRDKRLGNICCTCLQAFRQALHVACWFSVCCVWACMPLPPPGMP